MFGLFGYEIQGYLTLNDDSGWQLLPTLSPGAPSKGARKSAITSKKVCPVPEEFVEKHDLGIGDHLVVSRPDPLVYNLLKVNGEPPYPRPHLKDPKPPNQPFLPVKGHPDAAVALLLGACFGPGDQVYVKAPLGAGKTWLLRDLALTALSNRAYVLFGIFGERPKELTETKELFGHLPNMEIIASPFDQSPKEQWSLVKLALSRANRLTESGKRVVLFLDSLTRIISIVDDFTKSKSLMAGGLSREAVLEVRPWMATPGRYDDFSSLTIVAACLVTNNRRDEVIAQQAGAIGEGYLQLDKKRVSEETLPALIPHTRSNEETFVRNEAAHFRGEEMEKIWRQIQSLREHVHGFSPDAAIKGVKVGIEKAGGDPVRFLHERDFWPNRGEKIVPVTKPKPKLEPKEPEAVQKETIPKETNPEETNSDYRDFVSSEYQKKMLRENKVPTELLVALDKKGIRVSDITYAIRQEAKIEDLEKIVKGNLSWNELLTLVEVRNTKRGNPK